MRYALSINNKFVSLHQTEDDAQEAAKLIRNTYGKKPWKFYTQSPEIRKLGGLELLKLVLS